MKKKKKKYLIFCSVFPWINHFNSNIWTSTDDRVIVFLLHRIFLDIQNSYSFYGNNAARFFVLFCVVFISHEEKQTNKNFHAKTGSSFKYSCREHENKSLSWPFQKRTSYILLCLAFMAMFILQTQWLLDSFDHIQRDQLIKIMHLYMKKVQVSHSA